MNINSSTTMRFSALRYMDSANQTMKSAAQNISSGFRINNAADDPAGLAILQKLNAHLMSYEKAGNNIADANNMINTADGALSGVHDILHRMRELSMQAASDSYGDSDRSLMQLEYEQLIMELDDISTQTKFNDKMLFMNSMTGQPGAGSTFSIQTGPNNGDALEVSITQMVSGLLDLGKTDISTREGAKGALSKMDEAINTVSTQRATLGAQQNRLQMKANTNAIAHENTARAITALADADIAKEITRHTTANILNNAAMAMLSQANASASNVLALLR